MFLFIYLIYETAKLSREKIRHQFAMDSAAFVEMTNYSDFLNRTAYVNGAFPMRIFEEGYGGQDGTNLFPDECAGPPDKHDPCPPTQDYPPYASYADVLYKNGAFPRSQTTGKDSYGPQDKVWDIQYSPSRQQQLTDKNPIDTFELFTIQDANWFWHPWDLATEIYKLYVQIYSLLGSVEDAQRQVLKRLSNGHSFMAKSYWLNTGESGAELVASFNAVVPDFGSNTVAEPVCQRHLNYWGNVHRVGGGIQPYIPQHTDPVVDLAANGMTSPGCSAGLFQIMWVDPNIVNSMSKKSPSGDYPGIMLEMDWEIPNANYFNVDLKSEMGKFPAHKLRTTISLGSGDPSMATPSVWPNPTPKFQVRQFP